MPCSTGARSREERVDEWKPADAEVGSSGAQETMTAASSVQRVEVVSPLDTNGQVPAEGQRVTLSGVEVQRRDPAVSSYTCRDSAEKARVRSAMQDPRVRHKLVCFNEHYCLLKTTTK